MPRSVSRWKRTQKNQAARARPSYALLSFAFTFYGSLPVNSLGVPITRKSILVRPHQRYCPLLTHHATGLGFLLCYAGRYPISLGPLGSIYGGGGGSCTRVFPLLLSAVSDYVSDITKVTPKVKNYFLVPA